MKKVGKFCWIIPIFIALLLCYSTIWVFDTYDNPSFEQILFHLSEPIEGVESTLIFDYLKNCVLISLIETIIIFVVLHFVAKKIISPRTIKIFKVVLLVISFVISIWCFYALGLFEYIVTGNKNSTFIEDNYVDPREVEITFPDKKRNLIYIFVESLESSYLSTEDGGLMEETLIPELKSLAENNISFSDTDKIGGAFQLNGTSWTTAALISHTAGIPLKMGKKTANHSEISYFLGGAYTLGDVLFMEGYNQAIMFGSDAVFGNRGTYFRNHGFYEVYDYYDAISKKKIDDDYFVWWGYEDSKLFEYAKEEALNLAKENEPFNLTLLTVNTHQVDGYLEEGCSTKFDSQYENVIACTSYQVNEFINWCKKQDFYEDTTVIIAGDHLTMKQNFFKKSESSKRRVYNAIINASTGVVDTSNRIFSTMDMYPTTLAALGAKIEGNKLGLGTNLFSEEKTLIEKYGVEKVNEEFSYMSDFYNKKLLLYDDK